MNDIDAIIKQAKIAITYPVGSVWVNCAELAELYRRYVNLASAVNVLDAALTEAERQLASRPTREAEDRARFAQAVGALN